MRYVKPLRRPLLSGLICGIALLAMDAKAYTNLELAEEYYALAVVQHGRSVLDPSDRYWADLAHLYEQAHRAGHPNARADLGYLLLTQRADFAPRYRRPTSQGLSLLEQAIADGDERAMVLLAYARENGMGVNTDADGAVALYERAAQSGSTGAMRRLAELAPTEAERYGWWERSARAGDVLAMIELARMLAAPGAVHNLGVARSWLERARDHGDTRAMVELAMLDREEHELAKTNSTLRSELDVASDALAAHQELIQTLQADATTLNLALEDQHRRHAEAQEQLRQALTRIESKQDQVERHRSNAQRLATQVTQLQTGIDQAKAEADAVRIEWRATQSALSERGEQAQRLQAEVEALTTKHAAAQQNLARQQEGNEQATQEMTRLRDQLAERARELASHVERTSELEAQRGALQATLEQRDAAQNSLADQLTLAREALEQSNLDRRGTMLQLEQVRDEVSVLKQTLLAQELATEQNVLAAMPLPHGHTSQPADHSVVGADDWEQPGEAAYQVWLKLNGEGHTDSALRWLQAAANNGHTGAIEELDAYHRDVFRQRTTRGDGP